MQLAVSSRLSHGVASIFLLHTVAVCMHVCTFVHTQTIVYFCVLCQTPFMFTLDYSDSYK